MAQTTVLRPVVTAAPGASLIELITLQWQRERGELDLENFLLSIYFMRLGTLVERAYDRMCREALWSERQRHARAARAAPRRTALCEAAD